MFYEKSIFIVLSLFLIGSLIYCTKLIKKHIDKQNVIEAPKEENPIKHISMPINTNTYKETETITFDEYLYADKDKGVLKLNKNGDVVFNNKVIITNRNTPINNETAYTDEELKTLFYAKGIKPKPGCDPSDTAKNGTLGCYIDDPEED